MDSTLIISMMYLPQLGSIPGYGQYPHNINDVFTPVSVYTRLWSVPSVICSGAGDHVTTPV